MLSKESMLTPPAIDPSSEWGQAPFSRIAQARMPPGFIAPRITAMQVLVYFQPSFAMPVASSCGSATIHPQWLHGIPAAIQQDAHQPAFQFPQARIALPQAHDGQGPDLFARAAAERVPVANYDIPALPGRKYPWVYEAPVSPTPGEANVGKIPTAISIAPGSAAIVVSPTSPRIGPVPSHGTITTTLGTVSTSEWLMLSDKPTVSEKCAFSRKCRTDTSTTRRYWPMTGSEDSKLSRESVEDHVRDHILRICAIEDLGTPGNASMIARLLEPEQAGIALLIQHDLAHLYLHDVDIAQARIIIDNPELNPPRPPMWTLQGRSFREGGVM